MIKQNDSPNRDFQTATSGDTESINGGSMTPVNSIMATTIVQRVM